MVERGNLQPRTWQRLTFLLMATGQHLLSTRPLWIILFLFGVGPHQAALRNHSLEIKVRLALCKANILLLFSL